MKKSLQRKRICGDARVWKRSERMESMKKRHEKRILELYKENIRLGRKLKNLNRVSKNRERKMKMESDGNDKYYKECWGAWNSINKRTK